MICVGLAGAILGCGKGWSCQGQWEWSVLGRKEGGWVERGIWSWYGIGRWKMGALDIKVRILGTRMATGRMVKRELGW